MTFVRFIKLLLFISLFNLLLVANSINHINIDNKNELKKATDTSSLFLYNIDYVSLKKVILPFMNNESIKAIEELTNHDLLASFLVCLLGSKSKYSLIIKQSAQAEVDVSGFLSQFKY